VRPDDVPRRIKRECDRIQALLLSKNKAYGNSIFEPVRFFSHADPIEQIKVRIDDKLARIARGEEAGEDTVDDLIGYLILYNCARRPEEVPA
jgi:hypothetical protein